MQATHTAITPGMILVYAGLIPALFLGVPAALSFLSGWKQLAERFRLESDFQGRLWKGQSGWMRSFGSYNRCLCIGANEQGLYLALDLPFRLFHPPLIVPWNEVAVRSRKKGIFGSSVDLSLGRDEQVPLLLNARLEAELEEAAGSHWARDGA